MRVLAVTLARGGSKSVPKKNIKPINNKPLLAYTVEAVKCSRLISRYVVSTDDLEIKEVALQYGAEVPFLRPAKYASDEASSVSALQHAVEWVENEEGVEYDLVIEVMATNPLKTVEDIDSCISKLIETRADSVIAVHQLEDHHPSRIKKIVDDRIVDFCVPEDLESRRQDLKPKAYIRSGSIYALRRDHLMVDGHRYGSMNSRPYILPKERAINIDNENDFMLAEQIISRSSNN